MLIYVVNKGDSLYDIAKKFNVTVERIASDNQIDPGKNLVVGQSLIIRRDNFTYTVKPGDSLYQLAQRFNIPVENIIEDNNLELNSVLSVGQKLSINYDNPNKVPMEINGYVYPNVDLDVLRKNLPNLTYVSIFSYQANRDGTINNIQDEAIIREAYRYQVAPLMVITNISEEGGFSSDVASAILNNEEIENTFINNILSVMRNKGYYGVDFDFEYLYPEDREAYVEFLRKVTNIFHREGFTVSVALAPKLSADQKGLLYEAHDYRAIGEIVDHIIIMTYEWGYTWSEAMSVSPLNMVERVIQYAVTEIPSEKILMGIPNYGYDFNVPRIEDVPAQVVSLSGAIDLARNKKATIKFDEETQTPYFTYYEDGRKHEVHFDDARSIEAKINLAITYELGGLSYWTLMTYFNPNWLTVNYYIDVVKVIGGSEERFY